MLINAIGACGRIFGDDCLFRAVSCAEKTVFCLWTHRNAWMAGVFDCKSQVFQYSCLFCGNGGYCVLCTVVCGVEKSTVKCVYDLRNFSNRAGNRHLQYDL